MTAEITALQTDLGVERNRTAQLLSTLTDAVAHIARLDGLSAADVVRLNCRGQNYVAAGGACVSCVTDAGSHVYNQLLDQCVACSRDGKPPPCPPYPCACGYHSTNTTSKHFQQRVHGMA